jgi:molybdopterin-synthase adenylyltransferase
MTGPADGVRLRSLAVELIADEGGVTLRRGAATVRIDGAGAGEAIAAVVTLTADEGATLDEILACFDADSGPAITALVAELRSRRLLLPVTVAGDAPVETALDVFYWHFGRPDEASPTPPVNERVLIAGANRTSARLVALLREAGFGELAVVGDPQLDDPAFDAPALGALDDGALEPDIVVAVTDTAGFGPLRAWNERCLREQIPFLPVVVHDLIAYVGPLVVPGATACFECFLRRRYSTLDDAGARETIETVAGAAGGRVGGLHPAMSGVAADIAAMELTKFFVPWHALTQAGCVLTMNLLGSDFARRPVLKLPRCPACSSLNDRQPTAALRGELPQTGA